MTVNDRVVDVYTFEYVGRRLRINVVPTEEVQLDGSHPSPATLGGWDFEFSHLALVDRRTLVV